MGARERLPVELAYVREREGERALRVVILGQGERRTRSLRLTTDDTFENQRRDIDGSGRINTSATDVAS